MSDILIMIDIIRPCIMLPPHPPSHHGRIDPRRMHPSDLAGYVGRQSLYFPIKRSQARNLVSPQERRFAAREVWGLMRYLSIHSHASGTNYDGS